jgi:hypothetical protein
MPLYRMLDYLQSVIVGTPPLPENDLGFDENRWEEVRKEIDALYLALLLPFHVAKSALLPANAEEKVLRFDEFQVQAQMLWLCVRGNRYMFHDLPHLRDLLSPHDAIFKSLFDIRVEDFLSGLERLQFSLSEGIFKAIRDFKPFGSKSVDAFLKKGADQLPREQWPEAMREVLREKGWEDWEKSLLGRICEFDLFDVQKVTELPERLLRGLSWKPGEETEFFAPGEFAGWPLRVLPVWIRPFLCFGDRYYCFDHANLMDHIYRSTQSMLIRLEPKYVQVWNKCQQQVSEQLPLRLFRKILRQADTYNGVYYRKKNSKTGKLEWFETDGLVLFDDQLIVIEVKGGAFAHTPPSTDFPAYAESLRGLVETPAMQAERFIEYLESAEEVPIFDADHKQVGALNRGRIRCITPCCVTLDNFTNLAAKAEALGPLGVHLPQRPVWSISIDDLRVYSDIFDSSITFAHFLEQRRRATECPRIHLDDELDHLGLYLAHNCYVTTVEKLPDADHISWGGYRKSIDEYFHKLYLEKGTPKPLAQKMPERLKEIISWLDQHRPPGCCRVGAYILDSDGGARGKLASGITATLARLKETGRLKIVNLISANPVTVFCLREGMKEPSTLQMQDYTLALLLRTKDPLRLLLYLKFGKEDQLVDVKFEFLTGKDIMGSQRDRIQKISSEHAARLVRQALNQKGEIRRNEMCPCGSGRKYKRCCGRIDPRPQPEGEFGGHA